VKEDLRPRWKPVVTVLPCLAHCLCLFALPPYSLALGSSSFLPRIDTTSKTLEDLQLHYPPTTQPQPITSTQSDTMPFLSKLLGRRKQEDFVPSSVDSESLSEEWNLISYADVDQDDDDIIYIEFGPHKVTVKFNRRLPPWQQPTTSKLLAAISKQPVNLRTIWLKNTDYCDFSAYCSYATAHLPSKEDLVGDTWMYIFRVATVTEQVQDPDVLFLTLVALRIKADMVAFMPKQMFRRKDVEFVYEKTVLGSELRAVIRELVMRSDGLLGLLGGPPALLRELEDGASKGSVTVARSLDRDGKGMSYEMSDVKPDDYSTASLTSPSYPSATFPDYSTPPPTPPPHLYLPQDTHHCPSTTRSNSVLRSRSLQPLQPNHIPEKPIRQPRIPPPIDELEKAPNHMYKGCQNFSLPIRQPRIPPWTDELEKAPSYTCNGLQNFSLPTRQPVILPPDEVLARLRVARMKDAAGGIPPAELGQLW
jgi:hypothetical protein